MKKIILLMISAMQSIAFAGPVKLALNWKPEPQFGGFYDAKFNGNFKKQELDVEVLAGGSGTPTVQMLAAKKIDFAIVSADEVIMSQAQGTDVVALFAVYQTNPQGIMVHGDRVFKALKDVWLGDGVIALQKGLPYVSHLEKIHGASKAKLVPYLGGISNFLNDPKYSQQCFVTSEPLSVKKEGKDVKFFLIAESGYNPYTTVVATRAELLKSDPKMVKNFITAVKQGWTHYLSDASVTDIEMNKLNASMDLATFKASGDAQKSLIQNKETKKNGLGSMTLERWKQLEQQLFDYKVISKRVDPAGLFKNL